MYNYYMGKRSNIHTKNEKDPIVIEVDNEARNNIEKWLDKYGMDFDRLILCIKSFVKVEIEKIVCEVTQSFILYLADGNLAFIELMDETKPKCKLNIFEDEYIFWLNEECEIESGVQTKNGIKIKLEKVNNRITLSKQNIIIVIEMEKIHNDILKDIKNEISKLKKWDSIIEVICWIWSLPSKIETYSLSILMIDDDSLSSVRVRALNNRLYKYMFVNDNDVFIINDDLSWYSIYNGILFNYNNNDKKCIVHLPEDVDEESAYFHLCHTNVCGLIEIMINTLKAINSFLEEIE